MLTNAETMVSHLFRGVREIRAFRLGAAEKLISLSETGRGCDFGVRRLVAAFASLAKTSQN